MVILEFSFWLLNYLFWGKVKWQADKAANSKLGKKKYMPDFIIEESLYFKIFILFFQSWTSAPGRDSSLEYRLTIYHARTNDTGDFTCKTPFEQAHTIKIIVKDVSEI